MENKDSYRYCEKTPCNWCYNYYKKLSDECYDCIPLCFCCDNKNKCDLYDDED